MLKIKADKFEEERKEEDKLVISVTWIGFTMYYDKGNFHSWIKDRLKLEFLPGLDGSMH